MSDIQLSGFDRRAGFSRTKAQRERDKAADLQRQWDHDDWVRWHYRDTGDMATPKQKGSRG